MGIVSPFNMISRNFMALTTSHRSLDVIRRVCAESQLFCGRLYKELDVWDVRNNCLGTFYRPGYDVIYFSNHINPAQLMDFAALFPVEARGMNKIALPGRISSSMVSRPAILASLHDFENLNEVIIVLGNVARENGPRRASDTQTESWLGGDNKTVWTLPDDAQRVLDNLKKERWPDWKLPSIRVVGAQEDILSSRSIPRISGIESSLIDSDTITDPF